jgi:recombination protein RecT
MTTQQNLPEKAAPTPPPAPQQPTIASELNRCRKLIEESLPAQLDYRRFARLSLTTLRKTPQLQQCTPTSFIGCLLTAASLGLEPDVLGECYLVPYKKECQLILGYQGLAKLFWQSPQAAQLDSGYVCQNDEFSYSKGTEPFLHHIPAEGDRGPITHYWALVGLEGKRPWFDVFTPAQIDAIRGKSGSQVPDPEHWMERKTALKQVLKLAPKSVELARSMAVDETTQALPAINRETGEVLDGEVVE